MLIQMEARVFSLQAVMVTVRSTRTGKCWSRSTTMSTSPSVDLSVGLEFVSFFGLLGLLLCEMSQLSDNKSAELGQSGSGGSGQVA